MIEAIDKIRQQVSKLLIRISKLEHSLKESKRDHKDFSRKIASKIIRRKDILDNVQNPTNDINVEIEHIDDLLNDLEVTALAAPLDKLADFIKIVGTRKEHRRKNGVVIEITKKGYLINDDLLRPTHVIIVKND